MILLMINKTLRCLVVKTKQNQNLASRLYSSKNVKKETITEDEEPEVPVNLLKGVYSAQNQPSTGKIYDKKPFRLKLEADKLYSWCLCGESKTQPLCDKTHQNIFMKIKLRPIFFKVKDTKYYWLCNCKRTNNRPFCDGSHLAPEIKELKR